MQKRKLRLQKRLKNNDRITHGLFNLGIRLRHLQKRSLPRKTIIFALQMSKKHSIIVSNISVENGFKTQTAINRENVSCNVKENDNTIILLF